MSSGRALRAIRQFGRTPRIRAGIVTSNSWTGVPAPSLAIERTVGAAVADDSRTAAAPRAVSSVLKPTAVNPLHPVAVRRPAKTLMSDGAAGSGSPRSRIWARICPVRGSSAAATPTMSCPG